MRAKQILTNDRFTKTTATPPTPGLSNRRHLSPPDLPKQRLLTELHLKCRLPLKRCTQLAPYCVFFVFKVQF